MNYKEYTKSDTKVLQYYVKTSDNVSLKIIDFIPSKDNSKRPLILFVAGWISHIYGWKEVLQKITAEFRTIYLETREKTSSIIPSGQEVSFSIERLSQDIKEAIKAIVPEDKEFILAGSSLGATVIMEYLSLNIRNPRIAILISPMPEFLFPKIIGDIIIRVPACTYLIVKPFIKWYLRNFRLNKRREREQVKKYEYTLDYADPSKLKANAIAIKNYRIWEKLNLINTPCLIIGARTDSLHGISTLGKLKENIRNCDYKELSSNKETHSHEAGRLIVDIIIRHH